MTQSAGIEITGRIENRFDEVLTSEAVDFLGDLHRKFDARGK
jgi:malate synthase